MPTFENARSVVIAAPPEKIRALVANLHEWTKWSPWEGLDPDLKRTYAGAEEGTGARYAWAGKKSGEGSMVVTEATANRVALDLEFVKPFKASNKAVFTFEREGGGTRVTWTMSGERNVLLAVMGALFVDKMLGKDFERGLGKLKGVVER